MKAALIGTGPHTKTRAEVIRAVAGVTLAEHLPEATAVGVIQRREAAFDVVFVSAGAGRRVEIAEAALRQGRHVFMEWPPAASVVELERLAARAEEAGAEVGVSRPLRFHPLFEAVPRSAQAELVVVNTRFAAGSHPAWDRHLADVLDLCHVLAGARVGPGAGVRRLDAQAVRTSEGARFEAIAAGLRFHSGTYATLSFRRALQTTATEQHLHASGSEVRLEATLDGPAFCLRQGEETPLRAGDEYPAEAEDLSFAEALLHRETHAFLCALADGRSVPVSVRDALATLRLTEGLMQQLR